MARSSYIYVVIDPEDGRVDATFTVKWEMDEWLDRYYPGPSSYDIWRHSDGLWRSPQVLYRKVRDGVLVHDNSGRTKAERGQQS